MQCWVTDYDDAKRVELGVGQDKSRLHAAKHIHNDSAVVVTHVCTQWLLVAISITLLGTLTGPTLVWYQSVCTCIEGHGANYYIIYIYISGCYKP